MKHGFALTIYLLAVVTLSAQQTYTPLLFAFLLLSIISGKNMFKIIKKSFLLVAFFSLSISISYCSLLLWQGKPFLDYFLTVNLRAICITMLTMVFISRVNVFDEFSFSKDLTFLLVMSVSKIVTLQKIYAEYSMALASRTIKKPARAEIYGFLGSAVYGFLDRSMRESKENHQAMKSRGFSV